MTDAPRVNLPPAAPPSRPGPVAAYVALTRPRIIELLLVTTVPAMVVAKPGMPPVGLILTTLSGGTLAAAGANAAQVAVDNPGLRAVTHPGAADQVGIAVDGDDLLGAGGGEDGLGGGRRCLHQLAVVVALGVAEAGDGHAVSIGLGIEGDAVVGQGEELAQRAEGRPVDVPAVSMIQRTKSPASSGHAATHRASRVKLASRSQQ